MIVSAGWKGNGKLKQCEPLLQRGHLGPSCLYYSLIALKTMETINLLAISAKGKSRIGTKPIAAIVEQNHHDKLFVVMNNGSQCRWIKKTNDPDFCIIEEQ